jgi:hypothetical protein
MVGVLDAYRSNVYSQNGEDGVIAEILKRLDIRQDWFCEFGAWDGRYGSNSYKLLRDGWKGVMIEGDPSRFQRLMDLARKWPSHLVAMEAFVETDHDSPRSLDNLLATTPIPKDFAVISIDIDSWDYQVWQSLTNYRPKIVIIEVESSFPPDVDHIYPGSGLFTSFASMVKLGKAKGYTPVVHTGNIIFVVDELVGRLGLPPEELAHPERLYCDEWLSVTPWKDFRRRLKNITWQRLVIKLDNAVHERLRK